MWILASQSHFPEILGNLINGRVNGEKYFWDKMEKLYGFLAGNQDFQVLAPIFCTDLGLGDLQAEAVLVDSLS